MYKEHALQTGDPKQQWHKETPQKKQPRVGGSGKQLPVAAEIEEDWLTA